MSLIDQVTRQARRVLDPRPTAAEIEAAIALLSAHGLDRPAALLERHRNEAQPGCD